MSSEYDAWDKKLAGCALLKDKELKRSQLALLKSTEDSKRSTKKNVDEIRLLHENVNTVLCDLEDNELNNKTLILLENFEEKLTNYKFFMRSEYDSLVVQEKGLFKEVLSLEDDIDAWENPNLRTEDAQQSNSNREKHLERQTRDIERKSIIGAIDRKVQRLCFFPLSSPNLDSNLMFFFSLQITSIGRYGKWDSRDHDVFLKIWNQVIEKEHQTFQEDLTDKKESIQLPASQKATILKKMNALIVGKQKGELDDHLNW
jgi:hypothetical protein